MIFDDVSSSWYRPFVSGYVSASSMKWDGHATVGTFYSEVFVVNNQSALFS